MHHTNEDEHRPPVIPTSSPAPPSAPGNPPAASKCAASSSHSTIDRNSSRSRPASHLFLTHYSKLHSMRPNLDAAAPASPPTPAPSPTPNHRRPDITSTRGEYPGVPNFTAWEKAAMGQAIIDAEEEADEVEAFVRSAKSYFAGLRDARDRRRFMTEMLELCDNQLLSFISDFVGPRLKKDPFSMLPNELCLRILSFIDDPQTLARASQVSTRWHELLNDDLTWKLLCEKHAYRPNFEHAHATNSRTSTHDSTLLNGSSRPSSSNNPHLHSRKRQKPRSYRSHFKQRYLVDAAWRKGGKSATHHVTPDQAVVTSLHLTEKYIVVALDNAKIYIYSPNGEFVRSLKGHMMGVWAMVPCGDILVSGGCDRDVRVWNMETGKSLHKMRGHTSTIRCLKMYDSKTAISGSRDTTLRVWDIEKGEVKHVLQGHSASVRCLAIHGKTMVSGSYDTTARVWNISEARCEHILSGHFSQIYAIAFDGQRVVTGSLDTSVKVWDPNTGACLATLQGHTSLVGKLQMRGDTLVTGGSDGSIRVWSLNKFEPIHRLVAHDNSITSLQFDSTRIVSGGSDGCVKIWDLQTGTLVRELGQHADAVWRVAFGDEKAVTMATRSGRTYMEVWDFSAPDEDEDETYLGKRRSQAAAPQTSFAAATIADAESRPSPATTNPHTSTSSITTAQTEASEVTSSAVGEQGVLAVST